MSASSKASLEICGADCSLDFSDGLKVVDPSPGDSFNDAIDNGLVGAVEGIIETGEQASPINPVRQMTGTADSQLFHNLVQKTGFADTDSAAYGVGRFVGPMLIPTGGIGVGVKVAAGGRWVAAGCTGGRWEMCQLRDRLAVPELWAVTRQRCHRGRGSVYAESTDGIERSKRS